MIKKGDIVHVPFMVLEKSEKADMPYYLGYDTSRIYASQEMLEQWQQAAGEKESGKSYEDGLDEAWELAKKIICNVEYGGLHESELEQIFGYSEFDDVMKNYTAQEAAAKIAEWENARELKVGDVVEYKEDGVKGMVRKITEYGINVLWEDGEVGYEFGESEVAKTGRTIDIAGLLAQIGGAE